MKQKTKGLFTKKTIYSNIQKELPKRQEDKSEEQIQRGFDLAKKWLNEHKKTEKTQ